MNWQLKHNGNGWLLNSEIDIIFLNCKYNVCKMALEIARVTPEIKHIKEALKESNIDFFYAKIQKKNIV